MIVHFHGFGLCTGISIKSGGIKLVLWDDYIVIVSISHTSKYLKIKIKK